MRSMGLLLSAVFASSDEAYCGLERGRVFLHLDRAGLMGCWVEGSCRLRWRVWLRWDRLLLWWWLRLLREVPHSQRGRHWPRLRRIASRTAVCQVQVLMRLGSGKGPWSLPRHPLSARHIVQRLVECSSLQYGGPD